MSKEHKVFGIGLNKTGTSSLKQALVRLGYSHCTVRGQMTHKFFKGNFGAIFRTVDVFESFEDWPWPLMYQRLFERYGTDARYILTRRKSAEKWVESLKAHALITNPDNNPRKRIFGHDYPHGYEDAHMAFYENHLTQVRAYFAAQNASHVLQEICWEEGDGWQTLCTFLHEDVPATAFPHANRRVDKPSDAAQLEENQRRIALQLQGLDET